MSQHDYRAHFGREPKVRTPKNIPSNATTVFPATVSQPQDPPIFWYTYDYQNRDPDGRDLPTRHGVDGPSVFGFLHFGFQHNVQTERPIKTAYENNYPDVADGSHLEYLAFLTDSQGNIGITVRVVNEQGARTTDGA